MGVLCSFTLWPGKHPPGLNATFSWLFWTFWPRFLRFLIFSRLATSEGWPARPLRGLAGQISLLPASWRSENSKISPENSKRSLESSVQTRIIPFPFGTQKAGWRTESFPFVTQGSPSPPSLKDLVRTWRTSALKVVPQLIKRIGWNFEILLPEGGLIRGLSVHETKMLPLCYLDLLKNLCVDWSSYIYYI